MTDYCYVASPAQGEWYTLVDVVNDVMSRLRLRGSDIDRQRIEQLVPVAAEQINNRLDRVYPLTPAGSRVDPDDDESELLDTNVTWDILDALRNVTVELYLRRGPVARDQVSVGEVASAVDVAAPDLDYAHKSRWGLG